MAFTHGSTASTAEAGSRSAPAIAASTATARSGTRRGLLSLKSYKRVELATNAIGVGPGRVDLRAVAGWRDATEVSFYGVGNDTTPDAKSNFRLQQAYGAAGFRARGPARLVFDFNISYEDYTLESGTGASPSIEDVYTAQTAPGLGDNPAFAHSTWMGGVDWRPSSGYARRGGLYALTYDSYFDPDHTYTFDRLQADVVQHLPILRENWVLSLHGVARTTLDDEQTVPYFLLPALGSGSTLRAYPSWRFRDRHSLLLSGEWRWIVNRTFLDMAFFYDAGKVTARREDLNFKRTETERRRRCPVPRPADDAAARRRGARQRGHQPGVLRRGCLLR